MSNSFFLEPHSGLTRVTRYDDQGGPRGAASVFVPREAALAARQAAMDREKAIAQATPLPPTNDADLESTAVAPSAPTRRVILPKLPIPKFSLGKRPLSQPGRARAGDVIAATPQIEKPRASEEISNQASASPVERDFAGSQVPSRTGSENALPAYSNSGQLEPSKPVIPLVGSDPVSAVPARLLPSGVAALPGNAPPTSANLLSEALLMERGRRRLAATGQPVPPPPAMLRVPSTVGVSRSSPATRQPTPPTVPASSAQSMSPTSGDAILSPIPTKRMPKFKSVPTPISGTPMPGQHTENPMEMMEIPKVEKVAE